MKILNSLASYSGQRSTIQRESQIDKPLVPKAGNETREEWRIQKQEKTQLFKNPFKDKI